MRDIVFISKATPADGASAIRLAPKLEAVIHKAFADIISLRAGDQWRQRLTRTLRDRAVKMLLCCNDATLEKAGVQEEIGIAIHVMRATGDEHFIIPLKLERYAPVFGLANIQYVDFEKGWAHGLDYLLDEIEKLKVPKANEAKTISPNREMYRKQLGVSVRNEPERLVSNWLRIANWSDSIRFFGAVGALDHGALGRAAAAADYPMKQHRRGVLTFLDVEDANQQLAGVGRFEAKAKFGTLDFGCLDIPEIGIAPREAAVVHGSTLARDRVVMPTTYAGSEMTHILGETAGGEKATRRSPDIRPETVIYDVDLTLSLPVALTVTSTMNAIAHATEARYAPDRNPVIVLMCKDAMAAFRDGLPHQINDPTNRAARTHAQYAAWCCSTALGYVSMAVHHKPAHVFGASFGTPHAETHAILPPYTTAFNEAAVPELLRPITDAFGGGSAAGGLWDFAQAVGSPLSLSDVGIEQADCDRAAAIAVKNAYMILRPIEPRAIRKLPQAA